MVLDGLGGTPGSMDWQVAASQPACPEALGPGPADRSGGELPQMRWREQGWTGTRDPDYYTPCQGITISIRGHMVLDAYKMDVSYWPLLSSSSFCSHTRCFS